MRDFSGYFVQNLLASFYNQQVSFGTMPDYPQIVRIPIDWISYGVGTSLATGGVRVNMQGQSVQANRLDIVQSVIIDNTECDSNIYVVFEDTKYTVVAGPGEIVIAPVLTNVLEAVVYISSVETGSQPFTNVFFTNVQLPPLRMSENFTDNPTPPTSSVSVTYRGAVQNLSGTLPLTGVNFGTPAAGRLLCMCISSTQVVGSFGVQNYSLVSATIGGIPAIIAAQRCETNNNGAPDYNMARHTAIIYAIVPTGASGTVALTYSGFAPLFIRCDSYEVTGYNSSTPYFIRQGATNNGSFTLQMIAGSRAIMCGLDPTYSALTLSLVGATADNTGMVNNISGTRDLLRFCAQNHVTIGGTYGITTNCFNPMVSVVWA